MRTKRTFYKRFYDIKTAVCVCVFKDEFDHLSTFKWKMCTRVITSKGLFRSRLWIGKNSKRLFQIWMMDLTKPKVLDRDPQKGFGLDPIWILIRNYIRGWILIQKITSTVRIHNTCCEFLFYFQLLGSKICTFFPRIFCCRAI